ncbi:hypothetical protein V6N11_028213 [Hibiscus sabdariffa]|uniref:Transcription factor CBF/NF-Y/archaeal histone domain-containing protein n=1 Tax=Hibiscus sabdariffa TaxID=183260 RepID=A0ABR1ZWS6_9ROSI
MATAQVPASSGGGSHDSGGEQSPRSNNVREQERFLPIANISRIMKKALPANAKVAKDAKETVQEASDKCQKEKRKTINGDDLLWAMATLGFEDYIDPLKIYLTKYREGDTKGSAKSGETFAKKDVQPGPNVQEFLHIATAFQVKDGLDLVLVLVKFEYESTPVACGFRSCASGLIVNAYFGTPSTM